MQKNQATVSIISFSTTINVDQTIFKSENIKQFRPYIFTFEKYAEKCVSKSLGNIKGGRLWDSKIQNTLFTNSLQFPYLLQMVS